MAKDKPKPVLMAELCKGCGRCISSCPKECIVPGEEINQISGYVPVGMDLSACNACGLCIAACPEAFGLATSEYVLEDPAKMFDGGWPFEPPATADLPDTHVALPKTQPMVLKGNYAAAVGALLAGCRHVFGYPITPSTEGAELMAALLPKLDGVFLQAISEVATVNHMYGCGGAGVPCMTFTSSPGFSLMLEGVSYMIGAEVPAVFVNVMRGGPGLGNIAPTQSDIGLTCHGLGHGDTQAIALAPSTPQEMLDMTIEAFRLAFKYRNPVIILADGYLGQMTGRVQLPEVMVKPGLPGWGVYGDAAHRRNLINSIFLDERDLELRNLRFADKYEQMRREEQRSSTFKADDATTLVLACNTPARMAKGAVGRLRREGKKVGLFNPQTIWPFPIDALAPLLDHVQDILVVEASFGQLQNELRLALSHAGLAPPRIHGLQHAGGILPNEGEVVAALRSMETGAAGPDLHLRGVDQREVC